MSALSDAKKLAKYNYDLSVKTNKTALSDAKTLAKLNNELEQKNVKLQYDYNKALATQDRDWQERMANSAHQREIADLKAAGLNPVLSVTGGNGAATPSGSSASVSKPNVDMSLPRAVMDMAMAQLNSATQLQTTAMNNANAMQVVQLQNQNALDVVAKQGANELAAIGAKAVNDAILKGITSGDSFTGQLRNLPGTVKKGLQNLNDFILERSPSARTAVVKVQNQYMDMAKFIRLYDSIKARNPGKITKADTRAYKKYKRILKRNNYPVY